MKTIKCEMCGGTNFVKQDGFFVCQDCGLKYSFEEAKRNLVENDVTENVEAAQPQKDPFQKLVDTTESEKKKGKEAAGQKPIGELTPLELYKKVQKAEEAKTLPLLIGAFASLILGLVGMIVGGVGSASALLAIGIIVFIAGMAGTGYFFLTAKKRKGAKYLRSHCEYCGASYEGTDYGYKKIKSTWDSKGEKVTCNYSYEIECPSCGKVKHGKNVFSAGSIEETEDKLVKELDLWTGPEIQANERIAQAGKKSSIIRWGIAAAYLVTALVLIIVLAVTGTSFSKKGGNSVDSPNYYGKYVYDNKLIIEVHGDGVLKTNINDTKNAVLTEYSYEFYDKATAKKKLGKDAEYPMIVSWVDSTQYMYFYFDDSEGLVLIIDGSYYRCELVEKYDEGSKQKATTESAVYGKTFKNSTTTVEFDGADYCKYNGKTCAYGIYGKTIVITSGSQDIAFTLDDDTLIGRKGNNKVILIKQEQSANTSGNTGNTNNTNDGNAGGGTGNTNNTNDSNAGGGTNIGSGTNDNASAALDGRVYLLYRTEDGQIVDSDDAIEGEYYLAFDNGKCDLMGYGECEYSVNGNTITFNGNNRTLTATIVGKYIYLDGAQFKLYE